jgi:hypothetical protein
MGTEDSLNAIREIQKITGPDYCFASAKFFVGKLIGLYRPHAKLYDMFHSQWGRKAGFGELCAAWGLFRGANDFNKRVLPASLRKEAGVVSATLPFINRPIEFVQFKNGALAANSLLKSGVPVVAGVDLPEGSQRDHFITLVMDGNHNLWAVDSWDPSTAYSAVNLGPEIDLTKPVKVQMNADMTTIPCPKPWFGYYREKDSGRALHITYAF